MNHFINLKLLDIRLGKILLQATYRRAFCNMNCAVSFYTLILISLAAVHAKKIRHFFVAKNDNDTKDVLANYLV